jgi:hypothetical protein
LQLNAQQILKALYILELLQLAEVGEILIIEDRFGGRQVGS